LEKFESLHTDKWLSTHDTTIVQIIPSKKGTGMMIDESHTVKKGLADSRPKPGCHLPNSPWPGIIYEVPVPGRFGQNKSRNLVIYSA